MAIPDPCRALPDIAATFSNAYLTSLCVVIVNEHCCPYVLPFSLSLILHILLSCSSCLPALHCISIASSTAPHLLPLLLVLALLPFNCQQSQSASQQSCLCRCQLSSLSLLSVAVAVSLLVSVTASDGVSVSVAGLSMWKNRFQLAVPVPERTNLPAKLQLIVLALRNLFSIRAVR